MTYAIDTPYVYTIYYHVAFRQNIYLVNPKNTKLKIYLSLISDPDIIGIIKARINANL